MADPDPHAEGADSEGWSLATTVPSAHLARQFAELCRESRVPTRILPAGMPFTSAPGIASHRVPADASLSVWVPDRELPVALGVAEHLLPWFAFDAEGDATPEEIAAGLEEADPELRAAAARERERARQRDRVAGPMLVAILAIPVLFSAMVLLTRCAHR